MGTFSKTFSKTFGVVHSGSLLNQIPFKSDALVWLDGTISGNNFVDKISGKLFPITGKDFDANWTKGFPYKSAATISAPVGDATLIAADLNSYWYTAGTPNQIPVVSLFQDVDYEHKFFCRHSPQVTDSNGVETFEPRVSDIVIYSTVKTSTDLVKCQTYFGVPTEDLTALWVASGGSDATGTGTKAKPYQTIQAGNNVGTSGKTVYVKGNGTFREQQNGASLYLFLSKSITFISLGHNTIVANSAIRKVYVNSGDNILKGFVLDGENTAGDLFNFAAANIKTTTLDKCLLKNVPTQYLYSTGANDNIILKNCVIAANSAGTQINSMSCSLIDTCYLLNISTYLNTIDCIFINNKVPTCNKTNILLLYGVGLNAYGNDLNYKTNSLSQLANYTVAKTITIKYNKFHQSDTATAGGTGVYFTGTITFKCSNNKFESTITSALSSISYFIRSTSNGQEIKNNSFLSKTQSEFQHINAVGAASLIQNNWSKSNSIIGIQLGLGAEVASAGLNDNSIVINNRLIGYKVDYPDVVGATIHQMFVSSGINIKIAYNHNSHSCIGLVVKTDSTSRTYTSEGVYYNLFEECRNGIGIGGVVGINIFNNVIKRSSYAYSEPIVGQIMAIENTAIVGNQYCSNIVIKNNIIISQLANDKLLYFETGSESGCIAQNNVLIGTILLTAGLTNYTDLATAQAAGKLLGCIVSDPLLDANLIPSSPIVIGENLGVNYKDALDITTTWGSETTTPGIVTKKQPAAGNWQVGAYVV